MTHLDLTFWAPAAPLSINKAKGRHWAANRRLLEPWRDVAWAHAQNALRNLERDTVPVTVQVDLPFRTNTRRDPHNYVSTVVKSVVDGLVVAGVVPDDTPEWVTVLDPIIDVQRDKSTPLTAKVSIRPREDNPRD